MWVAFASLGGDFICIGVHLLVSLETAWSRYTNRHLQEYMLSQEPSRANRVWSIWQCKGFAREDYGEKVEKKGRGIWGDLQGAEEGLVVCPIQTLLTLSKNFTVAIKSISCTLMFLARNCLHISGISCYACTLGTDETGCASSFLSIIPKYDGLSSEAQI